MTRIQLDPRKLLGYGLVRQSVSTGSKTGDKQRRSPPAQGAKAGVKNQRLGAKLGNKLGAKNGTKEF